MPLKWKGRVIDPPAPANGLMGRLAAKGKIEAPCSFRCASNDVVCVSISGDMPAAAIAATRPKSISHIAASALLLPDAMLD